MSQNPLISIVIPAYNVENYIGKAIQSSINQTYKNIEIIVVNDGSTDATLSVIQSFASPAIIIIDQPNGGVMLARKVGIQQAKGELICFLDSDDYMTDNAIEALYNRLSGGELDIACANYYRISNAYTIEVKQKYSTEVLVGNEFLLSLIINEIDGYLWGRLYKKSLFDTVSYPEALSLAEDKFINIQIGSIMPKVGFVDIPAFYYVKRIESITHEHRPLSYYLSLADLIDEELRHRLPADIFSSVANHMTIMRLNFYYLYINGTSNPSLADDPAIIELYKKLELPIVKELMKKRFTPIELKIISLHRSKRTAPLGRMLTTVSRIAGSIKKRVKL